MNAIEQMRSYQEDWFKRIQPYLLASNLNVGSGHGFFSQIAQKAGISVDSIEVSVPEGAVNKETVMLYDGITMPFQEASFDTSLAMYVLHHTPDPETVINEMKRVTRKRIILVEELYRHLPGKIQLAFLDFSVNRKAGLTSEIHWGSYLTRARLLKAVEQDGWKITHEETTPHGGFDEVLWIIDKSE